MVQTAKTADCMIYYQRSDCRRGWISKQGNHGVTQLSRHLSFIQQDVDRFQRCATQKFKSMDSSVPSVRAAPRGYL